jgi:hypothetical protein
VIADLLCCKSHFLMLPVVKDDPVAFLAPHVTYDSQPVASNSHRYIQPSEPVAGQSVLSFQLIDIRGPPNPWDIELGEGWDILPIIEQWH